MLLHGLTVAAQALGLHLHVVEVRRADELDTAFAALPQARADVLLVIDDALVLSSPLRGRLYRKISRRCSLLVCRMALATSGWRRRRGT